MRAGADQIRHKRQGGGSTPGRTSKQHCTRLWQQAVIGRERGRAVTFESTRVPVVGACSCEGKA